MRTNGEEGASPQANGDEGANPQNPGPGVATSPDEPSGDELDPFIDSILEKSDEGEKRKLIRSALMMERYQSPHPHPDHLERYNELYPDAAKIIFETFAEQSRHRRLMESTFMKGSENRANRGQWLAAGIVLAVVASGAYAIRSGDPTAGGIIICAALTGGVLLVIAGVRPPSKKRARRAETSRRDHAVTEVSDA